MHLKKHLMSRHRYVKMFLIHCFLEDLTISLGVELLSEDGKILIGCNSCKLENPIYSIIVI